MGIVFSTHFLDTSSNLRDHFRIVGGQTNSNARDHLRITGLGFPNSRKSARDSSLKWSHAEGPCGK